MIKTKRVYEPPGEDDGVRILVDRLWPRGLRKNEAKIDLWLKDVAPSDTLRKWFNHDLAKAKEFKNQYLKELSERQELVKRIMQCANDADVTLLNGAKEEKCNNATVLKEYLEDRR